MMARRVAAILPPLTFDEALEVDRRSTRSPGCCRRAPACSPTGRSARRITRSRTSRWSAADRSRGPGEISLAHHGVLFLDEMPEFSRRVARSAAPAARGRRACAIARAARTAVFPARFMLVGAMNPCPCGYAGDPVRACRCTPPQVDRYASRLSGPLRDRIDLTVRCRRSHCRGDADADRPGSRPRCQVARAGRPRTADSPGAAVLNARAPGRALRSRARLAPDARPLVARALTTWRPQRAGLRPRAPGGADDRGSRGN